MNQFETLILMLFLMGLFALGLEYIDWYYDRKISQEKGKNE